MPKFIADGLFFVQTSADHLDWLGGGVDGVYQHSNDAITLVIIAYIENLSMAVINIGV